MRKTAFQKNTMESFSQLKTFFCIEHFMEISRKIHETNEEANVHREIGKNGRKIRQIPMSSSEKVPLGSSCQDAVRHARGQMRPKTAYAVRMQVPPASLIFFSAEALKNLALTIIGSLG